MLQNIRVVLVNTSHPGNIGGAARAMKNMGLSRLVLVDPQDFPSADAVARASGATDILDNAVVVGTLEEALADPVYGHADTYVRANGISWLHRWTQTEGRPIRWEPQPPVWIKTAYEGAAEDVQRNAVEP